MATIVQNQKAVRDILPAYLLDDFIDWIRVNLDPDDVFDGDRLQDWAETNGYIKES